MTLEPGEVSGPKITGKVDLPPLSVAIAEIAKNRLDAPKAVRSPRGTVAYGTDEGVNYKPVNEDRIVVDPDRDSYAVIDGMGGENEGALAAELLARTLLDGFKHGIPVKTCQHFASQDMKAMGVGGGGACYLAFTVGDGTINGYYAGDVQLSVYRGGTVVFSSTPENPPGKPHRVENAVRGIDAGDTRTFQVPILAGDRIVAGSDGLWDNLSPVEVLRQTEGMSTLEAITKLDESVKAMMRNDGKRDNISVLVYDVHLENSTPASNGSVSKQAASAKEREFDSREHLPTISNSTTWGNLISAIKSGRGLHGSKEFFSPQKLADIIEQVRSGVKGVDSVTHAGGLRSKVKELLQQEQKS